ncbi:hypothetical protein BaRGS_00012920 [Batillaria attramentaria]|uniref:Ribosomal protein eL8/eL30/eS12/Gadd45 domain-containing protein n=1 Tax=Batillaria attramentaria TaxID=370345 RepID=A0ABD0L9E4_9CAEN|nr:hypothetical protein BaRGS_030737 [Batillaria attramentaria]
MTLPELLEDEEEEDLQPTQVVQWLEEMIQQAVEDGRLACGVEGCVKLLSSSPEEVMLCILPGCDAANAEVKIQQTLIKAVCVEYFIHVLNTDNADKLTKLIHQHAQETGNGKMMAALPPVAENAPGYTCVLVKYPKDSQTQEEAVVEQLFKPKAHVHVQPYIELPA